MTLVNTFTGKNIFHDECEGRKVSVTILSGLNLAAGTLLGRITASGKYKAYNNANSDGSEVCAGVLVNAVNTGSTSYGTNEDTEAAMFIGGAVLVESALVGLDEVSIVDVNARSIGDDRIYIP